LIFKNFNLKAETLALNKKVLFFYLIILTIFFIWFLKHPSLRYGGYSLFFLTLSIPTALLYSKVENKNFFEKKFKYLVLLIIIIFNFKNISRIDKEFERVDLYKFENFPFFAIQEKKFISEKSSLGLTIYKTNGHCWGTPSPCTGSLNNKIDVKKKNGYYFLYK
jgi:hypothetical protein